MKNPVSKTKFKTWLESKKPTAIVGISNKADSCPIATFLKTLYPKHEIDANYETCFVFNSSDDSPYKTFDSPNWMYNFMEKIDTAQPKNAKDGFARLSKITAKKALDILAKC